MNLFDKLPENFFSVLSRKYKAVYAFALVTLYQTLRTYKTQIKRADYINELRSHGEEIMSLFDVKLDKLDDKASEDEIEFEYDDTSLYAKTNYIFKKLLASGWFTLERDVKTNIEYIYLPSSFYSQRIYESALRSDSEMVLICEEECEIIGFLYLSYSLEEAEINHVAVKKSFEGKGIASSLMRKAEKMLYEKEVEILRQKDKELCKKYCYKRRKNHNYDISGL